MAITRGNSTSVSSVGTGGLSMNLAVTAGQAILVIGCGATGTPPSDGVNTYTALATGTGESNGYVRIYGAFAKTTTTLTITFAAGFYNCAAAAAYSGVGGFGQHAVGGGAGSSTVCDTTGVVAESGASWVVYGMWSIDTTATSGTSVAISVGNLVQEMYNQRGSTSPADFCALCDNGPVASPNAADAYVHYTVTDSAGQWSGALIELIPTLTGTVGAAPTAGTAKKTTIAFTASPAGGTVTLTYAWAFGDGGTSTAQNPSYTYNTPGKYTATVTMTDGSLTPQVVAANAPQVNITAGGGGGGGGGTGGTLGNNTIGRHRAPKLSTTDRIETTDNYGGT